MSSCSLCYLGGVFDSAATILCGSDAVTDPVTGRIINMIPSPHLNVEVFADQRKALNPTIRDIQIGAVIDQIFGDKAKTKIAKRCIDFMTGNVNSYAQILNGLAQLDSISTYNNLAASLTA